MDKQSEKKTDDDLQANAATPHSRDLLDQFQAGDSGAATELFDRYLARLIALARSRLSPAMRRRIDPEDVVHSAYRSFFIRAAEGDFELQQSGDLWRLLAQITLNKVRKQAERQTAARRDLRREETHRGTPNHVTPEPTPTDAAALVEQVRLVFERLSGDERLALTAFLSGDSIAEIARQLSKSQRTVRRALARARSVTERELLGTEPQPRHSVSIIPPLTDPLPFSDFRLERLIGAGGMGKVYRATQLSTGESVAVKALRRDRQASTRAVKQFVHEAEVVAGLDHPGIIRVRGLGRFPAGGYFIVMDWIDGTDLQARLNQRQVLPSEGVKIVEAVAEAIQHSHDAGVVHCDLKPGNILLGQDGRVVVTDFGFAQLIVGGDKRTAVGGTLGYLAPELLHRGGVPTVASDVYSLGRLLERIVICASAPLADLCDQSVDPDPARRPQSAEVFLKMLRLAVQDSDGRT
ncbi:MAG: protein kinase [Pirellulales bacterium]